MRLGSRVFGGVSSTPLLGVLLTMITLAGCGRHNSVHDPVSQAGQVIAHVGTEDVTTQELENEFRLANVPPDKRTDAITKRVLGGIVVRKYLAQRAVAAKLDREPTVHLDIMRAREEVLAGALQQRELMAKVSATSKSEIDKYIGAHASQFAKRELLNTDQIVMPLGSESESIIEAAKTYKTLNEVEAKLKEVKVSYSRSSGVLDSGAISGDQLTALQAEKADDIFFTRVGPNGIFFKVTDEQARPLTGEEATNRARQMMRADLFKASAEEATQAALSSAKYEGDLAKLMADSSPAKGVAPSGK